MDFEFAIDTAGKPYLKIYLTGYALLTNPLLSKGTAFTRQERIDFKMLGLMPPCVKNLAEQRSRSYATYKSKSSDIEKYVYMRDLQDSNETLFYNLLTHHITELLPIVYTPTVGLGCQRFSHIYRRPRGVFISYPDRHEINQILAHPRFDKVKVIVVSDGERILGLGDQGVGGMGIPIGKLALYTACAGIHPAHTLPVLLDSGTDNPNLLADPFYLGWRHERVRGDEYANFIDMFITAVNKRFPHVLLQWEDFAQKNANPLLQRYADKICSFNDDIQGTAAVATGTLLAAIHVTNIPLIQQRIVIVGAGSAGCGIGNLLVQAMIENGLSQKEAYERFYLVDQQGLLLNNNSSLLDFQIPFAKSSQVVNHWQYENNILLKDVVNNVKPTLLIGVSGQPGIFTEEIVKTMASYVERPIIFPLSNPTERSEACPIDLLKWTNNKAIIGTGSPFGSVIKNEKDFRIDQTNNCYIFPGVGLGLIATKAKRVTNKMFMAAAKALASCSPALKDSDANLLPPLENIRAVSLVVAIAVAKEAIAEGIANISSIENIEATIESMMWVPEYLPYQKVEK